MTGTLEADERLRSTGYRHSIPLFATEVGDQEIVEAIESRMYALEASERFIAVHWSLLREARDEIERLRSELAQAQSLQPHTTGAFE